MPEDASNISAKVSKEHPSVAKLLEYETEYMKLEKEYMRESMKLQQKFEKLQEPFLERRKEEILSDAAPEDFWLHVLQSHPVLMEEIQEWDLPVLKHLIDIRAENLPDDEGLGAKGFKIIFEFSENDYLVNNVLTKTVRTEFVSAHLTEVVCKQIAMEEELEWKVGKDVTVHFVKGKPPKKNAKKKGADKKEPAVKKEERPSFFRTFFRTIDFDDLESLKDLLTKALQDMGVDPEEELDPEDMEEAYEEAIEKVQDDAYEVAQVLRDNIIPHAVKFYTGDAMPQDDDEEDDDDSHDEDEDDDDEDESDEESSVEGSPKVKPAARNKSPPKDLFKAPNGEEKKVDNEECKQQ
eukprot:g20038.t1